MIPILVQHFSHPSPKVRHAAAHAVRLVDDMPMDYQNRYFEMVIPALILSLTTQFLALPQTRPLL
jgi:vesicle coat complex subunit